MPIIETPTIHIPEHWLVRLNSFAELEAGWNSYSAPAPSAIAIDHAKQFLGVAHRQDTPPERLEPSAMGGVGATFTSGDREVVVEFYNSGTAHALFSDDSTDAMETRPVSTDERGFSLFHDEVRAYLHGTAERAA
jgi:hypothetical protein